MQRVYILEETGSELMQHRMSLPRVLCLLEKRHCYCRSLRPRGKTTISFIGDDLFGKKPHFSLIVLEAHDGLQHRVTLIAEKFSVCKCEP